MIILSFGQILFSSRQPWQQERDVRVWLGTILAAVVFAAIIVPLIFWRNRVIG